MPSTPLLIAVDGPAASGKGTIARGIASRFDLPHLDTGSLYRGVALALLRRGGDVGSEFAALRACDDIAGLAGDPELRTEAVGNLASRVSIFPAVRAALIQRQRDFASQPGGAVLDGRDIGTVIAPDARIKLFVTASSEVRAERRLAELAARELPAHLDDVLIDIRTRDARDASRDTAPLLRASDAFLLETSDLDRDAAVAAAIHLIETCLRAD
jgi:CMP/dCMP kinase